MGIPHFVVAVNKMDLVEYSQAVFEQIRSEFGEFLDKLEAPHISFIPISALKGDNVVSRSENMPWYHGPSLLEHLETVEINGVVEHAPLRFPVQRVSRPDHTFRGYAGQIASGSVKPGDEITVARTGRSSRVKTISTFNGDLDEAWAPMSVTLTLEDEIDISRGDLLSSGETPAVSRRFEATVVWFNEQPLDPQRRYLLKHTTQLVPAEIGTIRHRVNVTTLGAEPAETLEMNQIGVVEIDATRPIFFDSYKRNHRTGCFVVIDAKTNATVGAGMIARQLEARRAATPEERRTAVLNIWHDEAVEALRKAGFEVKIEP
jgi:sulfate adenylyltransferase large subunit